MGGDNQGCGTAVIVLGGVAIFLFFVYLVFTHVPVERRQMGSTEWSYRNVA